MFRDWGIIAAESDVDRPLFKRNNLRFDERTYFQRVLALPNSMRQRILKDRDRIDKDTTPGGNKP